jgi:hypothetical protein
MTYRYAVVVVAAAAVLDGAELASIQRLGRWNTNTNNEDVVGIVKPAVGSDGTGFSE